MSDADGTANGGKRPAITCYSDNEGGFMEWSQKIRGRLLDPMLSVMAGLGLRGNHVTFLSMVAGLAFCPLFLWVSKPLAFAMLLLHVLLDGLDGPLARYRGQATSRGSFTDTMADQLVVTASALTMMQAGYAGAWAGGLYLFFYAVVVAFAFVRNALNVPYSWLFRPRFLVFIWFVVEVYLWPGSIDIVLWAASGLLALKCFTGFIKIRRRM